MSAKHLIRHRRQFSMNISCVSAADRYTECENNAVPTAEQENVGKNIILTGWKFNERNIIEQFQKVQCTFHFESQKKPK